MGHSEDDRIRNKNRHQNEAFSLIEDLRAMGYDNAYIAQYVDFAITSCTDSFRNEVYLTVKSILRSQDEKVNS